MRAKFLFHIFLGACLQWIAPLSLHAQVGPVPGEFIVVLESDTKVEDWIRSFESAKSTALALDVSERTGPRRNTLLLRANGAKVDDIIRLDELANLPNVRSVEQNHYLESRNGQPDDPFIEEQWSFELIEVAEVWEVSGGGTTINGDQIVVAILDDGFKFDHPDLQDNVWVNEVEFNGQPGVDDDNNGRTDDVYGWNFKENSPVHFSETHGTAVAGILGARGNNGKGMTGINQEVKLMLLSVLTTFDIAQAFTYALEMRQRYNETDGAEGAYVAVTNTSLGLNSRWCDEFPSWGELYDPMGEAGILSVGATANSNVDVDIEGDMPCSCTSDYLVTVTNTDANDQKVLGAGYGPESIDLGAPGGTYDEGSFSLSTNDDYLDSFGGTSSACPHVAGVAALLYSLPCAELFAGTPAETALLIKDALLQGSDPLADLENVTVSGGRLNAAESMAYLHSYCQSVEVADFFDAYASQKTFLRISTGDDYLEILYGSDTFGRIDFYLFDALGREMYQQQVDLIPFQDQLFTVPTGQLAPGVYFLVMANGRNPITKKVAIF